MAINRLRQPEDVLLSKWGFKKPSRPVLNKLHPLSRGLGGLWLTGNETTGFISDISENGNNGKIVNGPLANIPSFNNGYSTRFSIVGAPNQYVDCGPSALLKGSPALTIICWVNYDNTGAFPRIISNSDGNNGFNFVAFNLTSNPAVGFLKGGTNTILDMGFHMDAHKWVFFAITYDNVTANLYYNGTLAATLGSSSILGVSTDNLCFATEPGTQPSASNNYPGGLEAVRIYNRALTAAEVLQLYVEPYAGIYDAIADRKVVGGSPAPPANTQRSYAEIWG